jgi:hypothetical protein
MQKLEAKATPKQLSLHCETLRTLQVGSTVVAKVPTAPPLCAAY